MKIPANALAHLRERFPHRSYTLHIEHGYVVITNDKDGHEYVVEPGYMDRGYVVDGVSCMTWAAVINTIINDELEAE